MRARLLPLLVAGVALSAAPDLSKIVAKVDRRTVSKLVSLAGKAEREKLFRTARRIRERVLALDPDNHAARSKLGYRRRHGVWTAVPRRQEAIYARKDEDFFKPKRYRDEVRALEEQRITELVRVCVRYGTPEQRRKYLEPLLTTHPGRDDLHEALGHARIEDRWVRPELVDRMERAAETRQNWIEFRGLDIAVEPSACELAPKGLDKPLAFFGSGPHKVASSVGAGMSRLLAARVVRAQGLLRYVLGIDTPRWDPPVVVFLDERAYASHLRALFPDPARFREHYARPVFDGRDYVALRAATRAEASQLYARTAAARSVERIAGDGHAWLREGLALLVAFEVFGTVRIPTTAAPRPGDPVRFTRDPPPSQTYRACRAWLREQLQAGRAWPLATLRALPAPGFLGRLQSWSFVRFLFLYDFEAARGLPAALKGKSGDAAAQVLQERFGTAPAELERLWRAFVIEIEGG